jgi:hypothetical protein
MTFFPVDIGYTIGCMPTKGDLLSGTGPKASDDPGIGAELDRGTIDESLDRVKRLLAIGPNIPATPGM